MISERVGVRRTEEENLRRVEVDGVRLARQFGLFRDRQHPLARQLRLALRLVQDLAFLRLCVATVVVDDALVPDD